jgi:hypothetical protein
MLFLLCFTQNSAPALIGDRFRPGPAHACINPNLGSRLRAAINRLGRRASRSRSRRPIEGGSLKPPVPERLEDNLPWLPIHLKLHGVEVRSIGHNFLFPSRCASAAILLVLFTFCLGVLPEPIPASFKQGSLHGLLLLKSQDGKVIAVGDEFNTVRGDEVRSEMVFHFRDGSIDDEVAFYRQGSQFQLVHDWHIQKGPSFPQPLDMAIDVAKNEVTWRVTKDGKSDVETRHMDLPSDLANGIVPLAIENFPVGATAQKVSYLVADPNPRIVQLSITRDGEDRIEVGGASRRAARFNVHIEIGGIAGAIAPILGKAPSDIKIWATEDAVPAVIKIEGALYLKGPTWISVLASPSWPQNPNAK